MNYTEAIRFLYESLPMYQRQGKAAYKADLENTLRLDRYFGEPHRHFRSIHVAGTNGKGSVSHLLASVFQSAGYRTGLYTSPHLLDFRERIRVDGQPVEKKVVTAFVNDHREIIDQVSPSFFEMTVAMAFDHFAREKVDMAIVETGMGGRLDSTNIILPELTVITNISLDHMEFLGNNIPAIAREKGGIIKEGVPLVLGAMEAEAERILLQMAIDKGAGTMVSRERVKVLFRTYQSDGDSLMHFQLPQSGDKRKYRCPLGGTYQMENLATALTAIDALRNEGWNLPESAVEEGLAKVVAQTGILGRWQVLDHNPRSICDTAHNPAGVASVMEQVWQTPWEHLHVVWGMVGDKDLAAVLSLLPKEARYYFTPSSVPRTLDAGQLRKEATAYGLKGEAWQDVESAYRAARMAAGPHDMIFSGGSTFVVADLLASLAY